MDLPLNQVILGNCVEVMKEWPENSVDCIVTDPPYGISFMGKEWDRALPPVEAFQQMIRVLKPGALAFVMSSPRQDVLWRMLALLEGVGFELKTSAIFWVYKTGFPKAYDVSKGIDRKLGLEQKIIGKNPNYRESRSDKYNTGKGVYVPSNLTEPASDLSKQWSGWKSQSGLKPAAEVIIQANKPRSEPTIVDNVLRWGTGAVNVDACRIPFRKGDVHPQGPDRFVGHKGKGRQTYNAANYEESLVGQTLDQSKGRFPANLLVSDGALDTGKITGAGITGSGVVTQKNRGEWLPHNVYGERRVIHENIPYMDVGDQSRYFDLDAWALHHGFLDVAKPSRAERDFGLTTQPLQVPKSKFNLNDGSKDMRFDGMIPTPRRNVHATVKPVKLMAYLIELGCPPKGIVVDPFLGSGTTCIAAKRLRRRWIGIEINPEYAEIAEARINIRGPLDKFIDRRMNVEKIEAMSDMELATFLTRPENLEGTDYYEHMLEGLIRAGAIERLERVKAGTWTLDQFMEDEEG